MAESQLIPCCDGANMSSTRGSRLQTPALGLEHLPVYHGRPSFSVLTPRPGIQASLLSVHAVLHRHLLRVAVPD